MANRFLVSGGNGNWNSTTNWAATSGGASGASFPVAGDVVAFDSLSGNAPITVNVASACASLVMSGTYAGTLTFNSTLTTTSTVTFVAACTIAGTAGAFVPSGVSTLTSGGKTLTCAFTVGISTTLTLADNWVVNGLVTVTGPVGTTTFNGVGRTLTCNGGFHQGGTSVQVSGSAKLVMAGGTWDSTSAGTVNVSVDLAGNVTVSGTVNLQAGTITYLSGTITTTGSTLVLVATVTFATAGMTWNNVSLGNGATLAASGNFAWSGTLSPGAASSHLSGTIAGPGVLTGTGNVSSLAGLGYTLTLNTPLTTTGTLTLPNCAMTFAGSSGWTVGTLTNTSYSTSRVVTLAYGNTYTVTSAFNNVGTSTTTRQSLKSSSPGNRVVFNVQSGATFSLNFCDPTDVDSSGGTQVQSTGGLITNSLNWKGVSRFLVAGGTGDWNSTTNWALTTGGASGAPFPVAGDAVSLDSLSGNAPMTVNVPSACDSLTMSGTYAGTLTFNSTLTTTGNVTFVAACAIAGTTGTLVQGGGGTLTSGGKTLTAGLTVTLTGTLTLADDWTCSGLVTLGSGSQQLNGVGRTLTCAGGLHHVNSVIGTAKIALAGGTWDSTTSNSLGVDLDLAGNVTVSGAVTWGAGGKTLRYVSGTITTAGSTLSMSSANPALDTAGMTWNNVTSGNALSFSSALALSGTLTVSATQTWSGAGAVSGTGAVAFASGITLTLNNAGGLVTTGTMTLPNGNITFAGSAGWTVGTLTTVTLLATRTTTLTYGNTYAVTAAFNNAGTTPTIRQAIKSSSAGNRVVLRVSPGATFSLNYCDPTDVDSLSGIMVVSAGATITNTLNWGTAASPGLKYACGSFLWNNSWTATTTSAITGLGFAPKAIAFYWTGSSSATDAVHSGLDGRRGMGFATGPTGRRCVSSFDDDAAATTAAATCYSDDAVAITHTTSSVSAKLDLAGLDADGFTVVVDQQIGTQLAVFWEAWGGDDVTDAVTGLTLEPGAPGVVPADAGFRPDVAMFAGVQSYTATNSVAAGGSGFFSGFATGPDAAENVVASGSAQDAAATSNTNGYSRDGECVAFQSGAGLTVVARAKLDAFTDTGYSLDWAEASTTRRVIYLAIKGGSWRAGGMTYDGNVAGNTSTVSGLPFTPKGLSFVSRMAGENAADTPTATDRVIFGQASSTSNRRALYYQSRDGVADAEIVCGVKYDAVFQSFTVAGVSNLVIDLQSINSDGFTLVVDSTSISGTGDWIGYLACGDAAAAPADVPVTPVAAALTAGVVATTLSFPVTPVAAALTTPAAATTLSSPVTPIQAALAVPGVALDLPPPGVTATALTAPLQGVVGVAGTALSRPVTPAGGVLSAPAASPELGRVVPPATNALGVALVTTSLRPAVTPAPLQAGSVTPGTTLGRPATPATNTLLVPAVALATGSTVPALPATFLGVVPAAATSLGKTVTPAGGSLTALGVSLETASSVAALPALLQGFPLPAGASLVTAPQTPAGAVLLVTDVAFLTPGEAAADPAVLLGLVVVPGAALATPTQAAVAAVLSAPGVAAAAAAAAGPLLLAAVTPGVAGALAAGHTVPTVVGTVPPAADALGTATSPAVVSAGAGTTTTTGVATPPAPARAAGVVPPAATGLGAAAGVAPAGVLPPAQKTALGTPPLTPVMASALVPTPLDAAALASPAPVMATSAAAGSLLESPSPAALVLALVPHAATGRAYQVSPVLATLVVPGVGLGAGAHPLPAGVLAFVPGLGHDLLAPAAPAGMAAGVAYAYATWPGVPGAIVLDLADFTRVVVDDAGFLSLALDLAWFRRQLVDGVNFEHEVVDLASLSRKTVDRADLP